MTKISSLILAAASLMMLGACNGSGYKKTTSGIMYRIVSEGKGPAVKTGDFIKLHYTRKVNDSLIETTYGKMPAYAKVDSGEAQYSPVEVFRLLHKGDSVVVVELVDSLLKKVPVGLPPFLKKGGKITTAFRVVDVFNSEDVARADGEAEMTREKARQETEMEAKSGGQVKEMESYLAKNNIKAQKAGKGTYVAIQDPGQGPAADSGKYVTVKYTGKLLEGNKVFESNMDGSRPPFSFMVGTGNVIRGWDDGLKLLRKGGKATLYIPGFLAYGPNPGPGGKTYEPLIFDVELVDVSDTPPMDPRMQGMPPQQGQGQGR
jgi:FKBP-type peptidyl-prolyl cis-trans isomerase FkpA